ncbi:MAG: pyridoxal phosphate-dependent aminotransferase [Defluviitaleaceae bacterium]|nr:pyridoxal phosphate-dependent aminotransferase [Defluviitaleaceae bacterium]
MYNFNENINRKGTYSLKYDFMLEKKKPEDVIPMWVADMDFKTPNEIIESIIRTAEHGIYGYTETKEDYFLSIYNWFSKNFGYEPKKEWLVKTPGVVYALAMAIKAYTNEGDSILVQMPVYYPFFDTVIKNNRIVIENNLIYKYGKYTIDFVDFENKIKYNNVKLFLLCSPHNPVMRSFTKEELLQMGNICKKYDCIVVSDEIHCDFVFTEKKHIVFSDVEESFKNFSLIVTAPTKTFNLSGLQVSNTFIANEKLRKKFELEIYKTGYHQLSTMGIHGCIAAYNYGSKWHKELVKYLKQNIEITIQFFKTKIPNVTIPPIEATFLIWLDFSYLDIEQKELENKILHDGKVWLHSGTIFGKKQGKGFMRMNIGTSRSVLEEALGRIYKSLK